MHQIFKEQLSARSQGDRVAMADAIDTLRETVSANGSANASASGAADANTARTDRRFPSRALTIKDLLVFVADSIDKRDVAWVIVASILVTSLSMLAPYLNRQVFDDIIPSGSTANLLPIAVVLIATGFGSVMFGVTRNLLLLRLRDKIDVSVQAAILHHTYQLPVPFFRNYSSGDLANRVMAVSTICQLLSDNMVSGLLTALFSLAYFYQVFLFAPSLAWLCVMLMAAQMLLIIIGYALHSRFMNTIMPRASRLSGFLFAIITGIQKIKMSGSEGRAFAQWAKAFSRTNPDDASRPLFISLMPALSVLLTLGGTGLLYDAAVNGGVQLADYIAFNMAYGQVSGAVTAFTTLLPSLVLIRSNYDLARPILDAAPESDEVHTNTDLLTGSIEVRHLRFRYPGTANYIFDDLNLNIRAGEYVAIVGGSGCGKSTLIRLMLGFENPESGSIFYDHFNLAKVNKQSIRQQLVGTCLQDGRLFGGSIFENITITSPLATMEDAWEAARLADVADDIRDMPMGMHTIINDNGTGVSGGQRQRILIARALVGKPRILFMDEATSALDNIRQENVSRNLASTNCTRICIAHRLSTIKACDRIIVLDKGKVVEEGNYETLMARKGLFYDLCKRQV